MLAALLETRVEAVVSSVDNRAQEVHAGAAVGANLTLATDRLRLYDSTDAERQFAAQGIVLMGEVRAALFRRNDLAHRVWSTAGLTG